MTPAARVAAAIEVLDDIFAGAAAERALSGWGRAHRFAGSKDRAAIRDHVFQALRCRASYGWLGGANTGRGVMIGAARARGDVEDVFSGVGHAPPPLNDSEIGQDLANADRATRLDCPDWLLPHFDAALGTRADNVLETLQKRAGVFLRVNEMRATPEDALVQLARDGIPALRVPGVKNAIQITENERKVSQSSAYLDGIVELQDPSSQTAIDVLGVTRGARVLDFCAGGGGKALALAATGAAVTAHDIDARRMTDIAPRARRAGVTIDTVSITGLEALAPFDLVFVDAPCSGSGTWRRAPAAKWDLTPARLQELNDMQRDILAQARTFVRPGGHLVYATCSVFTVENDAIATAFIEDYPDFSSQTRRTIAPHALGDGFFYAILYRANA